VAPAPEDAGEQPPRARPGAGEAEPRRPPRGLELIWARDDPSISKAFYLLDGRRIISAGAANIGQGSGGTKGLPGANRGVLLWEPRRSRPLQRWNCSDSTPYRLLVASYRSDRALFSRGPK
jgi:hypothetical protein